VAAIAVGIVGVGAAVVVWHLHPDLCWLGLHNTLEGEIQGVLRQMARLVQAAAAAAAAAAVRANKAHSSVGSHMKTTPQIQAKAC
jgi:hypothetical protein